MRCFDRLELGRSFRAHLQVPGGADGAAAHHVALAVAQSHMEEGVKLPHAGADLIIHHALVDVATRREVLVQSLGDLRNSALAQQVQQAQLAAAAQKAALAEQVAQGQRQAEKLQEREESVVQMRETAAAERARGRALSSHSSGRCSKISRGSASAAMTIISAMPRLSVFVASFAPFLSCL